MKRFEVSEFLHVLCQDDFLIIVHRSPDGDALGTAAALRSYLVSQGKRVCIAADGKIPNRYFFLTNGCDSLPVRFVPSVVIAVDLAAPHLLGESLKEYSNSIDLLIDHHSSNFDFGCINYIDDTASSAGEVLYDLFVAANVPVSKEMASFLYFAIASDTRRFLFSNTTSHTHEVIASLLLLGADSIQIHKILYQNNTLNDLSIRGKLLPLIECYDNSSLVFVRISKEMSDYISLDSEQLTMFLDDICTLNGARLVCVIRELSNGWTKGYLRSLDSDVSVLTVASAYNGGGHAMSAGFCSGKGLDVVYSELLPKMKLLCESNR